MTFIFVFDAQYIYIYIYMDGKMHEGFWISITIVCIKKENKHSILVHNNLLRKMHH